MKPDHPDPAETFQRVRQQLILAQVRIMELEDVRDETAARLGETESLLRAAQALADQKLDEAAHAEQTRADLQAQFAHLQHVQHVTHEALGIASKQLEEARQVLELQLRETATRQQRIEQLDAEIRSLRSSRSWRWTAWLRALERALGGRKP